MSAAAPPRRRRGRRVVAGVALVVVIVVAVAAVVASGGTFASYPRARLLSPTQQVQAPSWTQPCWEVARWTGFQRCLRVSGRVAWRQDRDPDGDGDRHLFVVSRRHVHIVKLPKELHAPLPSLAAHVEAVGWMTSGSHGRTELDAIVLRYHGRDARGLPSG